MDNNIEKEWLDILSGKKKVSENQQLAKNAILLRSVIKKINVENKNEADQLARLHSALKKKTSKVSLIKKLRLIIIFITGLMAGTFVPIQMATRGTHDYSFWDSFRVSSQNEKISIRLTIKDKAPLTLAKDIIFTAVDSKVEVKVLNNDGLHLLIYGLKPLDESQISLKATLGLGGEAEGNADVVILKDE